MSGRPSNEWKKAAKCVQCLEHNPKIGKVTEETLKAQRNMAEFVNLIKAGKRADISKIISLER